MEKQKTLTILILLICSFQSFACSCGSLEKLTKEEIEESDVIFVGEIIKIDSLFENRAIVATFKVQKNLKGENNFDTVEIYTNIDVGLCGVHFELKDVWYIFTGKNNSNKFWATICDRSLQLNQHIGLRYYGFSRYFVTKKYMRKEKKRFRKEKRQILKPENKS